MNPLDILPSPFVCRLCTGLPRFRSYNALRTHLRVIHGHREFHNSQLAMFEIYPGSRYTLPEFQNMLPGASDQGAMALPNTQRSVKSNGRPQAEPVQPSTSQSNEPRTDQSNNSDSQHRCLTLQAVEESLRGFFNRGFDAISQSTDDKHQELLFNMQQIITDSVENGLRAALSKIADVEIVSEVTEQFEENPVTVDGSVAQPSVGVEEIEAENVHDVTEKVGQSEGDLVIADGLVAQQSISVHEENQFESPTKSDEELLNVSMEQQVAVSDIVKMLDSAQEEVR